MLGVVDFFIVNVWIGGNNFHFMPPTSAVEFWSEPNPGAKNGRKMPTVLNLRFPVF